MKNRKIRRDAYKMNNPRKYKKHSRKNVKKRRNLRSKSTLNSSNSKLKKKRSSRDKTRKELLKRN